MPLFGPRERKDKRKATEEPSDGRGNSGKKPEVSNGSTQTDFRKKIFPWLGLEPTKVLLFCRVKIQNARFL